MKIRNFILVMVALLVNVVNLQSDFEKYINLKIQDVPSINPNNLPGEFSNNAFIVIDQFIKKTKYLNYECMIYFDYVTGEILNCFVGEGDQVVATYNPDDFKGKHVASLHNHPINVYSPPSDKNFSILLRPFEDYELIAGSDGLWILEAKGINRMLHMEFKFYANYLLATCQDFCRKTYSNSEKADDVCNIMYGISLSNYINDKNINHIQLNKKEYKQ